MLYQHNHAIPTPRTMLWISSAIRRFNGSPCIRVEHEYCTSAHNRFLSIPFFGNTHKHTLCFYWNNNNSIFRSLAHTRTPIILYAQHFISQSLEFVHAHRKSLGVKNFHVYFKLSSEMRIPCECTHTNELLLMYGLAVFIIKICTISPIKSI